MRFLSAGQRRRVALARVAGRGAGLWLLDEPTLGLDAASVVALGGLLAAHRAAGGVVVAADAFAFAVAGVGGIAALKTVFGCGARAGWVVECAGHSTLRAG